MHKIKLLLVGPCKSGKTTIANFLSEAIDNPETDYHPTQGVRILEYESVSSNNGSAKTEVELWDCSGDPKFDSCWPAFQQGVHGVVLVLNPSHADHVQHAERFLGLLSGQANIGAQQCLVIVMSITGPGGTAKALAGTWAQVRQVKADLQDGGEQLRKEMASFINSIAASAKARSDKEELSLLGLR